MRRELRKAPCPLTAHSLTALLRSASSRQGPLRWSAAEAPSGRGARSGTWSLLLPGGSWLRGGSPACDVPPSSNATQREALMMSRKSARRGDRKSRHLLKKGSRERLVLCLCRRTQIGTVVGEGRTWRPGRVAVHGGNSGFSSRENVAGEPQRRCLRCSVPGGPGKRCGSRGGEASSKAVSLSHLEPHWKVGWVGTSCPPSTGELCLPPPRPGHPD